MRILICSCLALLACNKPDVRAKEDALSTTPRVIPEATLRSVCQAQPCGGDTSVVRVYRDGRGNVARLYRLYGACSHSPGIYFDPSGTQTDLIPEKPIDPSSPEAEALRKRHDAQTGGLTHTDTIRCRDGARLPP